MCPWDSSPCLPQQVVLRGAGGGCLMTKDVVLALAWALAPNLPGSVGLQPTKSGTLGLTQTPAGSGRWGHCSLVGSGPADKDLCLSLPLISKITGSKPYAWWALE